MKKRLMEQLTCTRFDSPNWSFIITAALCGLFILVTLQPRWQSGTFQLADWPKADGTFNYRLALAPFTRQTVAYDIPLDQPAARQQRILYPLVVWLAAFGSPIFVPALLIFVNYFALCLLGWLGGVYAQTLTQHALWGVLLPLYPGCLISLQCDSPEILELCFLLASLICLTRQRHVCATILLVLALLTKETALLVTIAAAIGYALARWRKREAIVKWFSLAAPLAVFVIWQGILFQLWGTLAIANDWHEVGVPFAGFVRGLVGSQTDRGAMPLITLVEFSFIAGFVVFVLKQMRDGTSLFERGTWALFAGWVFVLNGSIWGTDWNFLRELSEFYLLGALIIIGGGRRFKYALGASVIGLWIWHAYRLIEQMT